MKFANKSPNKKRKTLITPMPKWLQATQCSTTKSERIFRGAMAVILAGFSLNVWADNLICAIPAAICSVFLLIGAITGWCPNQLLKPRTEQMPNTLGIPEAPEKIKL